MYKKSAILILLIIFSGILSLTKPANAGFGISPPYVRSDKVIPGTRYEQKITLLRSSADNDLVAEITVNAPEIAGWITVDKGLVFDLPKGQLQVPMVVRVDTPDKAALGNYKGHINIRIAPKGGFAEGGVSIALGARLEIDLTVTKETFPDFLVRTVNIPTLETLKKPWRWPIFARFFYRVKVVVRVENTGNVKIAPTKVHLDIYDLTEKNLLESGDYKRLEKVEPFETKEIAAYFPTKLPEGQYWGRVNVYKGNEVVRNDKLIFTITPPGSSGLGVPGYGYKPWLMLFGLVAAGALALLLLIKIRVWRYFFRILYILSWPLRFALARLLDLARSLKLKFWRWLHKKASRYQGGEAGNNPRADSRLDLSGPSREKTTSRFKK